MDTIRKPYDGQEPYIFVSYARKNKWTVFPVIEALQSAGYRVWWDSGIIPAADWADEIARRVDASAVCVAFHSIASAQSIHCKAEVNRARKQNHAIVSVYIEDGVMLPPGLEMYLDLWEAVKLWDYTDPSALVMRLGQVASFAVCREPEWHKVGEIQWKLDADGVLTIARNEDLPDFWDTGSIPDFPYDPVNEGSTALWMPYREKICSVVIENDVDEIGDYAFYGCTSLTAVMILDSVTKIGDGAFNGCASLIAVKIPDSVKVIGNSAFWGCASLTAVTIPYGVTEIGVGAFSLCARLTAVTIPDRVTKIGMWAFADCPNLHRVEVPAGADVDPVAFDAHTQVIRRGKAEE